MKQDNITLCWITDRRRKLKRFGDFLNRKGYEIVWLDPPTDGNNLSVWFLENIPSNRCAILLQGEETEWLTGFIRAVRSLENPYFRHIPLVYLYENEEWTLLQLLASTGINDFCHVNKDAMELLFRLQLRVKQAEEIAAIEIQMREKARKDEKSRVALKQREEFFQICARDLQTPLGLVQASLSMIVSSSRAESSLSPFHSELLTRADRQVRQALAWVNDLIDVMDSEQALKLQYKCLRLNDILLEFCGTYQAQATQKGIQIKYENEVKDWRVLTDPSRLRQLLEKLFTNALSFGGKTKNIFVSVKAFTGRRKTDPIYPMMLMSINDEQPDMAPHELEKIVDQFSHFKDYSRSEGLEMDLTIPKPSAKTQDGNFWVENTEGKGATFHLLFPYVISRVSKPGEIVAPSNRTSNLKVVVVEPSEQRRGMYFQGISALGHELYFAKDGVESVALIFHVVPDIVILTPNLPKMGGADVAFILRTEPMTSHIPLLLAVEGEAHQEKMEELFVDHLIILPFSKETLQHAIELVMKRREMKLLRRAA